jgi:MarR family transcriptional regulator for hemolysin
MTGRAGGKWGPVDAELRLKQYSFAVRVILIGRRYRSLLDDRLRPLGYSPARMEALFAIAGVAKPVAQIEIARRIGIEGPTLTRMLDVLQEEGLIERVADARDRRSKLVRLTVAGKAAVKEIGAEAEALRQELLEGIAGEDLDRMNALMGGLIDRLYPGVFG